MASISRVLRHIVVLVSHCGGKFGTKYCWCCIGTSKLFEIFCVDFVRVSGSRCILRIYETRTEWVISAYFLKDLGFSNVLHSLIRVEILQYLSKSWRKYHRIDADASFLGSIHTQDSIDVVLWFQFCQKISLMSHCGSISAKKLYWCHVVGQNIAWKKLYCDCGIAQNPYRYPLLITHQIWRIRGEPSLVIT